MRRLATPFPRMTTASLLALLLVACGGGTPPASVSPSPSPRPSSTPVPTPGTGTTASPVAPSPSPTPSPRAHADGLEGLVADLEAEGVKVTVGETFNAEPLAVEGVNVCVGPEELKVYVYGTEAQRLSVSRAIDPNDATNIGTSIVEWDGAPKFWARDRILVLYLGRDALTTNLLIGVLGNAISHGQDRPQRLPGTCAG